MFLFTQKHQNDIKTGHMVPPGETFYVWKKSVLPARCLHLSQESVTNLGVIQSHEICMSVLAYFKHLAASERQLKSLELWW